MSSNNIVGKVKIITKNNISNNTNFETLSDTDSYYDSNETYNILDNYINDNNIHSYDNGNRLITKCPLYLIKEAFNNQEIDNSDFNRFIDFKYVDKIKESFNPIFSDPIILAKRCDKNDKYEIIDGQHRMLFIIQTNDNNILKSDIPLDIRLCNNDEEFKKFINITNNRKNFDSSCIRRFKTELLLIQLNKEFNKKFFGKNRPFIVEEIFKTYLYNTKFFNDIQVSEFDIINKIKKINLHIKNFIQDKINNNPTLLKKYGITKNMIDKCFANNIFLGINKKLEWISLLDCDETEWNKLNISFI